MSLITFVFEKEDFTNDQVTGFGCSIIPTSVVRKFYWEKDEATPTTQHLKIWTSEGLVHDIKCVRITLEECYQMSCDLSGLVPDETDVIWRSKVKGGVFVRETKRLGAPRD